MHLRTHQHDVKRRKSKRFFIPVLTQHMDLLLSVNEIPGFFHLLGPANKCDEMIED